MAFVYIIQAGLEGPYKIGMTSNVDTRIQDLQVGNHEELRIVAAIDFQSRERAQWTEKTLHKIYSRAWIRGEWFRPTIELKRADAYLKIDKHRVTGFDDQKQEIVESDTSDDLDIDLIRTCPF